MSASELALLDDGWERVTPAEAGFAPDVANKIAAGVTSGDYVNLHGVVIVRHGKLVFECYFEGEDERWGDPLGKVGFAPDVKHDMRSASKSVVGLLYGIALAEGTVPGLDGPLVDQFPDYQDLAGNPDRRRMTVAHALTMTMGIEWSEDLPYTDPRNSEIAMEMASDRYRFILERPFVTAPGERWNYTGGATAILAHLVSRGASMPLFDYAREKLFGPLGIDDAEWIAGTNGEAAAASGLRLRPRDLAKIGQLALNRGRWGERQLVPEAWLQASFSRQTDAVDGLEYGYQWWLVPKTIVDPPWIGAFGNGSQRLLIVPGTDLVVAITAGNYNRLEQWKLPTAIMIQAVLPGMLPT